MANKKFSKEIILETAFELSKEIGVNALSMRMLAKELGCSVMPIYDAFESKENLVKSLSVYCIQETMMELDSYSIFERYHKMIDYGFRYPKFFLEYGLVPKEETLREVTMQKLYSLMRKDSRLKDLSDKALHLYNFEIEMFIVGCVYMMQNREYDADVTKRYKNLLTEFADALFGSHEQ